MYHLSRRRAPPPALECPDECSATAQVAQSNTFENRKIENRVRGLIIHDPAHHGANGAAMPTEEGDQDGHFFFNHPERGDYLAALARAATAAAV